MGYWDRCSRPLQLGRPGMAPAFRSVRWRSKARLDGFWYDEPGFLQRVAGTLAVFILIKNVTDILKSTIVAFRWS